MEKQSFWIDKKVFGMISFPRTERQQRNQNGNYTHPSDVVISKFINNINYRIHNSIKQSHGLNILMSEHI